MILIELLLSYLFILVLSFDLDTSDNSKQELSEKVSNLRSDFSKCSYFIVPSILKLDNKTLKLFYKEEKLLKEI